MTIHYRTPGIVIKKEDKGEADQVFTIYTKDFGKLEVLGKAIRKIKSKLRPGTELFYLSEVEFIQGKTYKTLTDAILIERHKHLRRNLKRLAISYRISEALNTLVRIQEPDKKIWQLLNEVFQKLNNPQLPIPNYHLLYYYFLWNLLSILGYQPELYNCAVCQKKIMPGRIYFNSKEGGVICFTCFKKIRERHTPRPDCCREIHSDIVKILRIILKKDWNILARLKMETLHQKMLKAISTDFLLAIHPRR